LSWFKSPPGQNRSSIVRVWGAALDDVEETEVDNDVAEDNGDVTDDDVEDTELVVGLEPVEEVDAEEVVVVLVEATVEVESTLDVVETLDFGSVK
jgi:hypothetical protein